MDRFPSLHTIGGARKGLPLHIEAAAKGSKPGGAKPAGGMFQQPPNGPRGGSTCNDLGNGLCPPWLVSVLNPGVEEAFPQDRMKTWLRLNGTFPIQLAAARVPGRVIPWNPFELLRPTRSTGSQGPHRCGSIAAGYGHAVAFPISHRGEATSRNSGLV